jgi:hypothetical protein
LRRFSIAVHRALLRDFFCEIDSEKTASFPQKNGSLATSLPVTPDPGKGNFPGPKVALHKTRVWAAMMKVECLR